MNKKFVSILSFVLAIMLLSPLSFAKTSKNTPTETSTQATQTASSSSTQININTADAATLETLKGIGPQKAQAIIDYRQKQPFKSVDDLLEVHGISDNLLSKIRDQLTVS